MNVLIQKLNKALEKYNLNCTIKKETNTLLDCYLYDINDYTKNGAIYDYRNCKKLDIKYKKDDLVKIIANNNLDSFAKGERKAYDMAKELNMLRS
jgi:hypothetical protein